MDSGHFLFIANYLVAVAAIAALMRLENPKMTAGRIALWVGGGLPASVLIILIGLLVRLVFSAYPHGPEGNAYGFAILLLLLILDTICALGGMIVAWVVARALAGFR